MKHLLSIVVPIYNVKRYLPALVDSILNQTYRDFELLLVDDGSTDSSGQIIDDYAIADKRVKAIHKKNGGCFSARNFGIDLAKGDLIAIIDSDDVLDLDMFEILIHNLDISGADVSCCAYVKEYEEDIKNNTGHKKIPERIDYIGMTEIYESITSNDNSIEGQVWNKVWKKEIISGIKFRGDIAIVDDAFFTWTAMHNAKRVCYVNLPMYHYRIIQTSIMRTPNVDKSMSAIHGYEMMMEDAKRISQKVYDNLAVEYVGWNLTAFKNLILQKNPNMNYYKQIKANLNGKKAYWGKSGKARAVLERSIASNYSFSKFLVKQYLKTKGSNG